MSVVNEEVSGLIVLRRSLDDTPVLLAVAGDFDELEAFALNDPITMEPVTLTEIGDGEYRWTFTPSVAGPWELVWRYTIDPIFDVRSDQVETVVSSGLTFPGSTISGSGYGNIDTIKLMLDIEAGDTTYDDRLAQLNVVASQELADACGPGVSWGAAGADVEITYTPTGTWSVLVLQKPIVSITSITIDGDLADPADYSLVYPEPNGLYWGIKSDNLIWHKEVAITGQWGGQPLGATIDDVPADVVEAVNVLVAGYQRRDQTSEGQVTGPERFTFVPPNPWTDQRVVRVLDRYDFMPAIIF